jgi:hypothetical protein
VLSWAWSSCLLIVRTEAGEQRLASSPAERQRPRRAAARGDDPVDESQLKSPARSACAQETTSYQTRLPTYAADP